MRIPTQAEYETAVAALAVYEEFRKPYVQKNGWTVIPADAPRPVFDGAELTTDRVNAFSTVVELYSLARDKPERFSAYVVNSGTGIVTWTGERVGVTVHRGQWHRNNFGSRYRHLTIRADWGAVYHGREYDSRQLINLRRVKRA